MKKFLVVLAGVALFAAPAVNAQGRPLRLFYSTVGLTDLGNTNSPAADPTADLNLAAGGPVINNVPIGQPVRLFVWAQITPPGTPNNATYNGVHLINNVTGTGGSITGHSFWNYTNGAYGNGTGRWQNFTQSPAGTSNGVSLAGAAVTTGAGVSNTPAAATNDTQHRRFATNGTTRIDATLLGWIQVTGTQQGELQVRFSVGSSGIAQSGQPVQRIYMGWGDEASAPLGNQTGGTTPVADAIINVIPEPASLMLLGLAGLALRRR